jgi:hypothetical protein
LIATVQPKRRAECLNRFIFSPHGAKDSSKNTVVCKIAGIESDGIFGFFEGLIRAFKSEQDETFVMIGSASSAREISFCCQQTDEILLARETLHFGCYLLTFR